MTLNLLPLIDTQSITTPYTPQTQTRPLSLPSSPLAKRQKPNSNMMLDGYMFNKELRFVKKIGAGTYGLIYLVENIYTGRQYAAKMVLKQPPLPSATNSPSTTPTTAPATATSSSSQLNKQQIQARFYNYFLTHLVPNPASINFEYIKSQGHDCPFLTEIALHLKVHEHPNVATIHEVFNLENFAIVILLDYFEQGDLFGNIIDKQIFQKHQPSFQKQLLMKNAMLQLVDAIEYCHQNSVYHCDLKPENIMVRYNPNYKRPMDSNSIIDYNELHLVLIDFGLAMESDLICCNACRGSSFYMAPERTTNFNTNKLIKSLVDMSQYPTMMKTNAFNESNCKYLPTLAGDIWSLGVLFINITCSRNPWPVASFTETNNDVFKNYILNNNKAILSTILPISHQFNTLLNKIFVLNPNSRIDLISLYKEIIRCNFFKDTHSHSYGVKQQQQHQHRQQQQHQHRQQPHAPNPQLYTPPESTAYNSYASEFEEEDEEDVQDEDNEEDYEVDEEYTDYEDDDYIDADEADESTLNTAQLPITPKEQTPQLKEYFLQDAKAYAKKICQSTLPQFAFDAIH
ncbi:hypothetical protein LELG_01650 [Lodderomyces elongisporus NRRL YB-4239]|uniref:Protein kinase domain-containing protein n=1 Tax=Lodderomyces elongisporus (strain ATCC 11503 / CBS 2605 / JCM 1781 / NBRC 1676 / NRRL YB-4239) TaxID=379508 RepID=A5DWB4_LODEL|nr:hypothetical protein LELG_01650 [Lodderomyces elongisporus NRRL YB-4239]